MIPIVKIKYNNSSLMELGINNEDYVKFPNSEQWQWYEKSPVSSYLIQGPPYIQVEAPDDRVEPEFYKNDWWWVINTKNYKNKTLQKIIYLKVLIHESPSEPKSLGLNFINTIDKLYENGNLTGNLGDSKKVIKDLNKIYRIYKQKDSLFKRVKS